MIERKKERKNERAAGVVATVFGDLSWYYKIWQEGIYNLAAVRRQQHSDVGSPLVKAWCDDAGDLRHGG